MKISEEKKNSIILYILNKIDEGERSVSQKVADSLGINQSTVHSYLNEMTDKKIIRKIKRGKYEIVNDSFSYEFRRSKGELDEETEVFRKSFSTHISNLQDNVRKIWDYVFSEMINNVIDHSNADKLSIIVNCNYLKTEVIIDDNGVGIFEKIREYFGFNSIDDAICELFKGKLTTDSENHSGEGIFFSSKLVDEFYIISDGRIFTNNKYDEEALFTIKGRDLGGTCVIMSMSNFAKRNAKDVFDQYVDDEGGFVRTRIPLGSIFETDPISRSQAKRICSRFESFKEVILDFTDVNWMGQGFAHQIFVVFANSHKSVNIIPVNMNEDVTKMYRHVMNTSK